MSEVFYTYEPTNEKEKKRRQNIEKFLDGLIDEETPAPEPKQENPAPSQKAPTMPDELFPKLRYLAVMAKKPKKEPERFEECWKMSPQIPRCFFKCPPELANLPSNELRAFDLYPGLLTIEKVSISQIPFSIHRIKHSNSLIQIYTGLPVALAFFKLASMFRKSDIKYYNGWIVGQLTVKQQLLLTIMKLKLALTDVHLSVRFRCSLESVTNTFYTWLFLIYDNLYGPLVEALNRFTPGRLEILFRFKTLSKVTVYSEVPPNPHLPHRCPLEPYNAVVAFRPDGLIVFSSELYTWNGQMEDIIQDCGILSALIEGDVLYHDRTFKLGGLIPEGVLSRPIGPHNPKIILDARNDLQFRLMDFDILKCIPTSLWDHANTVWHVVVILSNFGHFKPYFQAAR